MRQPRTHRCPNPPHRPRRRICRRQRACAPTGENERAAAIGLKHRGGSHCSQRGIGVWRLLRRRRLTHPRQHPPGHSPACPQKRRAHPTSRHRQGRRQGIKPAIRDGLQFKWEENLKKDKSTAVSNVHHNSFVALVGSANALEEDLERAGRRMARVWHWYWVGKDLVVSSMLALMRFTVESGT
jgi:hypothetical protein